MAYTSVESTVPTMVSNEPPVIIMHGLLGSKAHWNFITKGLHAKTKRKVYALDARNHGESEHSSNMTLRHIVEDIKAFMQTANIKKALLVGHGMGAQAMMTLALKHPKMVDQLVVVDTSPISSSPSLYLTPTYLSAINNVVLPPNIPLSVAKQTADDQLRRAVPGKILRKILLANLVPAENSRYKWRMNLTAIARNFINISTFPPVPWDAVFDKPTLFVQGGRSDNIKRSEFTDIRKLFPKAEFKRFGSTGHWLHLQRPREFVGVVGDFISLGKEVEVKKVEKARAVREGAKVVPEVAKVVREEAKVVREGAKVVREGAKVVREGAKVVREGAKVVPEEAKVVRDKAKVLREEVKILRDEAKVVNKETKKIDEDKDK